MSLLKTDAWRDPQGAVRWGWVVGLFALLYVVLFGLLLWLLMEAGLLDFQPVRMDSPRLVFQTLPTLLAAAITTLICWRLFKVPTGLRDARGLRHGAAGFALGLLSGTACVLVPMLVGVTSLTLTTQPALAVLGSGLLQLFTLGPAGVAEELVMRGLGFQAFRRRFGDVPAIVTSGAVFGVLHLDNPDGSWVGVLIIALCGVWFAQLTVRTGSLWLAAGLHVSWNWAEGYFYGQPVSGHRAAGALFEAQFPLEAGFWSGGGFGPEAAGWTAVVLVAAIALTAISRPRASAALT